MQTFQFKIKVAADSEEHAKKVAQVVQNMVSDTTPEVQKLLYDKITKVPGFFKRLLQNPIVQNFIK